jgi:multidrug resistance protein MdtO
MTASAESGREPLSFARFLVRELAPREGRTAAVARISSGCAITVMIAMLFRIPEPAYMAYVVLLISKDEQSATIKSALGGFVAVTLAIILCLLLFAIDAAEPALRLPAMALVTFGAMYTSRVFALGPISFLAGFVLVLVQSLVDDLPHLEALTRATLWLWVVILVPVAIAILTNLLAGQHSAVLLERTVLRALERIEAALRAPGGRESLTDSRAEVLAVLPLSRHAVPHANAGDRISEGAVRRLLDALTLVEGLESDFSPTVTEGLADRVRAIRLRIQQGMASPEEIDPMPPLEPMSMPALMALAQTIHRLEGSLGRQQQEGAHPSKEPHPSKGRHSLFVPDAFTNPAYLRFAVKSTIAVMAAYSIYTLLDYPGARTAIVTCFFVALGTLGETVHKLLLRVSGAIIGGILAALCIVFVLPWLTDIGQLSILILCVSAGCAWIATSSERLSYAGLQIAFAFFLGVLNGYAPATDLTVLRDRVAGILIGNVIVTVVFTLLWPESARQRLRAALADLFRAIAALIRAQGQGDDEARLHTAAALVRVDDYGVMQAFELRMLEGDALDRFRGRMSAFDKLAGAALVASSGALQPYARPDFMAARARWADETATRLLTPGGLPAPPPILETSQQQKLAHGATAALRADQALQHEIDNVVGATE